jgi:hypothetical protein
LFYCAEISWSRRGRRDRKAETETVLSLPGSCFTAQRYSGAAGNGGTEKRIRKRYYPSLFYCAEISWSHRERRDGKAETETELSIVVLLCRDILEPPGKAGRKRYYPSLFYCAEISWSRRERRDGKAETETVLSLVVFLRRDILEPPGTVGRKSGNGTVIIHHYFTAQRYPGAAGKGGTEKRKRKPVPGLR